MMNKNVPPKISIPVGLVLYLIGRLFEDSWGGIIELAGGLMFLFGLFGLISGGLKSAYARFKNKEKAHID